MPECTEAERNLLDVVLSNARPEIVERAERDVRDERMTPEAKERVIVAIIAERKASADTRRALDALGLPRNLRSGFAAIYDELNAEAERRMREEALARLVQESPR